MSKFFFLFVLLLITTTTIVADVYIIPHKQRVFSVKEAREDADNDDITTHEYWLINFSGCTEIIIEVPKKKADFATCLDQYQGSCSSMLTLRYDQASSQLSIDAENNEVGTRGVLDDDSWQSIADFLQNIGVTQEELTNEDPNTPAATFRLRVLQKVIDDIVRSRLPLEKFESLVLKIINMLSRRHIALED